MEIGIYSEDDFEFGMEGNGGAVKSALSGTKSVEQEIEELENDKLVINPKIDDRKISTENGKAQVFVTSNSVTVTNQSNGMIVNDNGVIIAGRTHLVKDPSQIRVGGFWVFNPEIMTCLPSTTYTPIPVLEYKDPPYAKSASALAKIASGA